MFWDHTIFCWTTTANKLFFSHDTPSSSRRALTPPENKSIASWKQISERDSLVIGDSREWVLWYRVSHTGLSEAGAASEYAHFLEAGGFTYLFFNGQAWSMHKPKIQNEISSFLCLFHWWSDFKNSKPLGNERRRKLIKAIICACWYVLVVRFRYIFQIAWPIGDMTRRTRKVKEHCMFCFFNCWTTQSVLSTLQVSIWHLKRHLQFWILTLSLSIRSIFQVTWRYYSYLYSLLFNSNSKSDYLLETRSIRYRCLFFDKETSAILVSLTITVASLETSHSPPCHFGNLVEAETI